MAVGRITGPLLARNLNRDGVDLSFETDLLYLDVGNGRIGIKTVTPQYELDVNGTLHALRLLVDTTGTIGLVTITSTTSSSTLSTLQGPFTIEPGGLENIYLNANTFVRGDLHATGNITADGDIRLGDSTSTDTLIIGAEVNSDIIPNLSTGTFETVGTGTDTVFVTNTNIVSEFSLGTSSSYWLNAFSENLYTKTISPVGTQTDITVFPNPVLNSENFPKNALTINGDIRVYGSTPIGTAPVVTNVLYVTMDGDDNNDGRAEDASRACRTVSGATQSPYYKQGTVIKVRSGHYYEQNPIELLPYTCVIGDDLRTTFIEPINKTVDLFHVNSGVYVAQMTFLNLRRGEVTRYAPGGSGTYTTGAYCVAFPPRLEDPIDVFYSPYIQNCTNQSGPWLNDGTMFVPNQTVQAPNVVAYSTYGSGTDTILISVATGTIQMIELGNAINGTGIKIDPNVPVAVVTDIINPDPAYQEARLLLENNKEFIKEEVIGYLDTTAVINFDTDVCKRDVGYIVDAIIHDAILGGNAKSVKAGLAYWNGNTSLIPGEVALTSYAFRYVEELCKLIVANEPPAFVYQTNITQYITTSSNGVVVQDAITNCVDTIIDILENWDGVKNASSLLTANRSFIQAETVAYVNNVLASPFNYDQTKCSRDVGLIVNGLALDLLYQGNSQSNFSGIQYWNQSSSTQAIIPDELSATVDAYSFLQDQVIAIAEVYGTTATNSVDTNFNTLISVLSTGTAGITDAIISNGVASTETAIISAYESIQTNKASLIDSVITYIDTNYSGLSYTESICRRDTGYVIDSICFDLLHGGNRQTIQSAVYYYGYSSNTAVPNEEIQVVSAYKYLKQILRKIVTATPITNGYQSSVLQITNLDPATNAEADAIDANIDLIIDIIKSGPNTATKTPISLTASTSTNIANAVNLINANSLLIQYEIIGFINSNFSPSGLVYDEELCYRDVGLIVDAVQSDIVNKSNTNSIIAGRSYWDGTRSLVRGEIPQTAYAVLYAKELATKIIENTEVTALQQSGTNQVINLELPNGDTATTWLRNSFDIISNIIEEGPGAAPATTNSTLSNFIIVLSTSTVAGATNDLMYFGDTYVFPLLDDELPSIWTTSTNADRRLDPHGGGGGALVDGNAPSSRSPIQSFVFDAFTQLTQGGHGIHIINKGYAQLVSVFTIFADVAVHVEGGGICSITNSNANFGDLCLVAEGYGPREFGGTVYNPGIENYPLGFYPYNQEVEIFVPNPKNRPHIGLVMEVVPPDTFLDYDGNEVPYINEQGYPGFLSAATSVDLLTTSSRYITPIDTTGICIGQNIYVRDQYGNDSDIQGRRYVSTTTVVTAIEYQKITLSEPINQGGGETGNNNYFSIYACGNAYYNVLSSTVSEDKIPAGQSKIAGQENETIAAIDYLKSLAQDVITNTTITPIQTSSVQVKNLGLNGINSTSFVGNECDIVSEIILSGINNAPTITTTGSIPNGNTDAITLLNLNRKFIQDEVIAYVNQVFVDGGFVYDETKCSRDTGLIVDSLAFDLLYNGTTQSAFAGLQYWAQTGLVGQVVNEKTTTTNAINHIASIITNIIESLPVDPRPGNTTTQITGNAGDSDTANAAVTNLTLIKGIITNGVEGITDMIVPNGNEHTTETIVNGYNLILANKQFITDDTIAWINGNNPGFTYDETKCRRDIGYILDCVAFDILHSGNRQSVQAAAYYYDFDLSTSSITGEVTQTIAAYNYIKSIISNIITCTPISGRQNTVSQVINLTAGTPAEAATVQSTIDVLTDIISTGPTAAPTKEPISQTASSNSDVVNAYALILANKNYIIAETIAYINDQYPSALIYNQRKCHRDVGLIIDAIVSDLSTGGNARAVEAGTTYYSREGTYHLVKLEDNIRNPLLFVDGISVNFYQRSYMSASGYLFEYVGAGTQYGALPQVGKADPVQSKEVVQLNNGKVFFTSTDQNGDFRIGPGLVISQATGVLSGRTFEKSLFAQMTPFILAVEAGSASE